MRVSFHSVFHFLKNAIAPGLSRVPPGWAQSRLSSRVDSNWARFPVSQDLANTVTVAMTWSREESPARAAGAIVAATRAAAKVRKRMGSIEHYPCQAPSSRQAVPYTNPRSRSHWRYAIDVRSEIKCSSDR